MRVSFAPSFFKALSPAGCGRNVLNGTLFRFHRQNSIDRICFAANPMAASQVIYRLTASSNLASALIKGFWASISGAAILSPLRRDCAPRNGDRQGLSWARSPGPRRLGC